MNANLYVGEMHQKKYTPSPPLPKTGMLESHRVDSAHVAVVSGDVMVSRGHWTHMSFHWHNSDNMSYFCVTTITVDIMLRECRLKLTTIVLLRGI